MAQAHCPKLRIGRPRSHPPTPPRPAVTPTGTICPEISAKIIRESQARAVCTAPRAGCGRILEHVATIELFNTLGGKIEALAPVGAPALRMYCCGPTVYD